MFASMFAEDNRKSIKTCNRLKSPEDRKKQTDNLERLFCQGLKQSAVNKHSPDIKSQNTDSSGNGTEETGLQKNRQTLEMSRTDKSLVTPDVDATKPKAKTSEQLCKTDQLERGEGAKDSGQNTECKNMPIIGDDHADVTSQKKHKQNSLVTKQNAVTDKEACDPKEKNKFSDNNVGQPAEFDKTGTKTHEQIPARVNLKSRISPETSTQEAKENKGGKEDRSVENGQSSCSSNQTGSNPNSIKPLKPSTCKKEFEEKVKRRKSEEATEDRSDKSKYEDKMKKVTEKLESLFGKEEEEYDIKLVNEEGRKSSSEDATDRDSKRNVKEMENVDVSKVEEASKTVVNLTKCSPKQVKDRKRKSCDKNNEERQQCTVPEANPISKDMDKTTMQVVLEDICTKGQKETEETVDISPEQKSNKLSKTETKRDLEKGNKLTKDSRNLKCNKKKDVEKSEEAANTEVTDKSETNSKPMLTRSQVNQNQTQENVKDKGEKVVTSNDEQTLKALRTSPRKKVATQAGGKVTGTNTDLLLNDVEKPVGKTACPEIECLKPDKTSAEVASTSKVADENKTTDSNKSKTSLKLTESRGRVSNVKRKIKFCSIEGDKDTDGKPLGQNTLFNNPEKLNQISSSFVAKHSATKPSVKEDKPCKKIGTGIKDTAPSMNKQHSNTDTITETPLGNFGTKNSKVKGSRSETAPDTKIPSESISKQSKPLIEVDHVTSQRSAPIYSSSDSSSSEDTVIINKSHDTKIFEKKVDDVVKNYFKNLDQADNEKDKSVDTTDAPVVKKLEETSKAVGTESSEPKTSAVDKFSISNNSLGTQSNSDRSIIKRRITPTPVRDDKPVCSFENILTKNSQTFTAATVPSHQSPLQLTHEGDIPVLHLEENQIANMPTEMNINDKNIITLLDTMNISNIECDIPKFRSVCGDTSVNTEANTSKDNNGLSFENMIGKAVTSTPRVAAKPEEKTTTNSSSVSIAGGSNVSSTNSSTCNGSVPFVRRRRRVRLVMLD
ncbi:hypothetical protein NQ315_005549 [Exocentrus adspersus]|uniref:Breast cancer type 1 susceptibility protein-like protein n=1 Tax=Exocentrus adspersus TaxID=1586481 RepID=A0AAV8VTP9_9CUCU|nr:hypothetical protein NQ315_005549 [Exocentrus adspersus]